MALDSFNVWIVDPSEGFAWRWRYFVFLPAYWKSVQVTYCWRNNMFVLPALLFLLRAHYSPQVFCYASLNTQGLTIHYSPLIIPCLFIYYSLQFICYSLSYFIIYTPRLLLSLSTPKPYTTLFYITIRKRMNHSQFSYFAILRQRMQLLPQCTHACSGRPSGMYPDNTSMRILAFSNLVNGLA